MKWNFENGKKQSIYKEWFHSNFYMSQIQPGPFLPVLKINFWAKKQWGMKNPQILYFFRVVQNDKLNNLEEIDGFEIFGSSLIFVQKTIF